MCSNIPLWLSFPQPILASGETTHLVTLYPVEDAWALSLYTRCAFTSASCPILFRVNVAERLQKTTLSSVDVT